MNALSDTRRAALNAIGDVLIPAALGMPSFTDAGDVDAMVDHVLALRPELTGSLNQALDRVGAGESGCRGRGAPGTGRTRTDSPPSGWSLPPPTT